MLGVGGGGGIAALSPVVRVGAALAALGALQSLIAGIGRTVFAMSSQRDLPAVLAAVHPRYRVPHHADLAVGAIVVIAVGITDVRSAIGFSSFAVLTYYAIANAAAWTLGTKQRRWPRALAALGLLGCATLAFTLPSMSMLAGAALLAAGAAIHGVRRLFQDQDCSADTMRRYDGRPMICLLPTKVGTVQPSRRKGVDFKNWGVQPMKPWICPPVMHRPGSKSPRTNSRPSIAGVSTRSASAARSARETNIALAAALTGARTADEVAQIMVRQGVDAMQASIGVFVRTRSDGWLEIIAHFGVPERVIETDRIVAPDAHLPTANALHPGNPNGSRAQKSAIGVTRASPSSWGDVHPRSLRCHSSSMRRSLA